MPQICGITGLRKSGKTFFCNYVVQVAKDEFGINIRKLSFADPLKKLFTDHKNITLETLEAYKEEFRKELEDFSSELKKDDPFLLTNLLIKDILPLDKVILDDVRLIDIEIRPLLELKASIYRVYAEKRIRLQRGYKPDPINDSSRYEVETELPQEIFKGWGGYYIFNNKDNNKLELIDEAKKIVRRHFLTAKIEP